jgi:hypothetical protein
MSPLDACLRVSQPRPRQLMFEERTLCTDAASARPGAESPTYDVVSLTVLDPNGAATTAFCVDNLARAVDCDTLAPNSITLAVDADRNTGADGTIRWTRGGRLDSTFASIDANAQPHLSDVGSGQTPQPTTTGGYSGVSTNPTGLLE